MDFDTYIKEKVNSILKEKDLPESPKDYIETDNIGEVIEKLIILHIRTWMLEDKISICENYEEIGKLKEKIDICFKFKRPKYIEAINKLIYECIVNEKMLVEKSIKLYQGF